MSNKPAFDPSELMSLFSPDKVAKMFDPKQMGQMFDPKKMPGMDLQSLMQSNQRNVEAMLAANQAAADAYKAFYEKQMEVYKEVMGEASKHAQSLKAGSVTDMQAKQREIYEAAVQKALAIMSELATTTKQANEEAFKIIRARVDEALKDIRQK